MITTIDVVREATASYNHGGWPWSVAGIFGVEDDLALHGEWSDFWATAVARTVYGDNTLQVVSVPGEKLDSAVAAQANDVVYFMLGDRLLPAAVRR